MELSKIDSSNMLKEIESLPEQIEHCIKIFDNFKSNIKNFSEINSIVLVGMGGSAIGGDIINSIISEKLKVPFQVIRDYNLPGWVDKNTLVFCVSYSGNTEETISCFNDAVKKKSKIVGITSGGKLFQSINELGLDLILIPKNKPPRASIGYLSIPTLLFLEENGLIDSSSKKDLLTTSKKLRDLSKLFNKMEENNPIYSLAKKIFKTIPVIYGDFRYTNSIALRWRGQIQENSKMIAFHNSLPEMNHNEIVGYVNNEELFNQITIIWLKEKKYHPRINLRQKFSFELLSEKISSQFEIDSKGESFIERLFYLVFWGDWLSYWLAILQETDPTPVVRIEELKKKLVS